MFDKFFNVSDNNINVIGLTEELKSIYIHNLFLENKTKNIIYVKNTLYDINKAYSSISNYNPNTLMYPIEDMNLRRLDAISPELKTIRMETTSNLKAKPNGNILITNLSGYLKCISNFFDHKPIIIKTGSNNMVELINKLNDFGYEKQSFVNQTGEYAVKGYILDIFSVNKDNPIRIEFFGDDIVSIREFNIDSQKSLKKVTESSVFLNVENNGETNLAGILENIILVYDDFNNLLNTFKQNVNFDSKYYDLNLEEEFKKQDFKINFSLIEDPYFKFKESHRAEKNVFLSESEDKNIKEMVKLLASKKKVLLCVENENKARKLYNYLSLKSEVFILTNENNLRNDKINIIAKEISEGFTIDDLVVINHNELIGVKGHTKVYKSKYKVGTKIKEITDLTIGDYVVHEIYGIGLYKGIKTIKKADLLKDFLQIEYKNSDKVYIPVEKIEYINKYANGDTKGVKINRIGTTDWEKAKIKAQNRAKKVAYDLLNLYAVREKEIGFAFNPDDNNQQEFERDFRFIPTEDQVKAMQDIKTDMENPKPMDRLLCGDVGFGKTEVAFRAAFKAVNSAKQVMILCPTTILSRQHYANARERFSFYPINFAILNRFTTSKEAKYIIKKFSEGKIDVLIGTHRILSDDVTAKDLGLLIVDEEQRFGVNHKEKIKDLKKGVDVLSLSATPIPRTIQMTMSGMRDLSTIETPPLNRYPVQTYVLQEDYELIKSAVYNEISRGGQAFILNNDVKSMELVKNKLLDIMPDIKIGIAHGKMNKHQIENVMNDFSNNDYNVLLCTTIIETGIDIPNVNTLIILDSNNFGLSQLYQLRGRVGRSDKVAYCYLMYKKNKILTELATKRLKIIKDFTALGSGLSIAIRDLSLRGAGDILGSEQSGFISSVGVELFLKMVKEEVAKLKGETIIEQKEQKPILDVYTHIDGEFDEQTKIEMHQRINDINTKEDIIDLKSEFKDRFGDVSENLLIYMHEELLEKRAMKLGISTINRKRNYIEIVLEKDLHQKLKIDELFHLLYNVEKSIELINRGNQVLITFDKNKLNKHYVYVVINILEMIEQCWTP